MDSCPSRPHLCTEQWWGTHTPVSRCGWELGSSCEWGSSLKAEDSCSSSPRPCTHTWYPSQPEQSSPSSQTYWARNLAEPRRPPLSQNRRYWSNIERAGKRKERWWSERWYAKNTLKIAWIFSHRRRLIRYFINKKINNAEVWLWLKSILVLPRLSCEIIFSQSQTSVSAWTGQDTLPLLTFFPPNNKLFSYMLI